MAKETMIIFVYDTQMVQREEDDPASAILYFHPTWVSDQQKASLCGQIMGTIQCVKSIFSTVEIVSLQSGKFFVIENGRYLLAVGTDRNINDWLLKHRAKTLYSLVSFFHKDFESLATIYKNDSLSAKLYHIFETYLKMIVFGGNIFTHIPSLTLPKSASNVFMDAIHILQCCQEFNYVLGGCILYHNKVVATQVGPDLSKRLVLTDPYRIKCPAETAEISFDLPLGVQLLQVYISNKEYCSLLESSLRNKNVYQYLCNKSIKKGYGKNMQPLQDTPIMSAMKRDQSLIFTAVPEEGSDHTVSATDLPFVPATKKIRPKFLNLKSISIDSSTETKTAKPATTTPFCGQTSVCSTPMTDLKKFIHQNPLSICRNNLQDWVPENEQKTETESQAEEKCHVFDVVFKKSVPYMNITSKLYNGKKYLSLIDIEDVVNSISKDAMQYFAVKNKGLVRLDLSPVRTTKKGERLFKTITDPTFPVFKADGTIVSRPYYEEYVKINLEMVQLDAKRRDLKNVADLPRNGLKTMTDIESACKARVISENSETDVLNMLPKVPKHNKEHRKSLTLPLKSFSTDSAQTPSDALSKRYSSGVQLTPLMSKLSMLAFEERSSGFCSRETTPCDYRGLTPTQSCSFPYGKYKASKEVYNARTEDDSALQKCILFVCGQQDVVLTMLLREECGEEPNTVKKLVSKNYLQWEICTEHLGRLEKQLNYCMESQSGANPHESEPYSYLCVDSKWDTVKRGGPWGANDLGALNALHGDFCEVHSLVEMMMRGGDSVIYGYHCGPSEVFYHETASTNAGLPPPADPMGLVQLKAKRRLERDHAIILL